MEHKSIKLIVGLGNPGPNHQLDRHNAGFWLVDALAARYGGSFRSERKFSGDLCRLDIDGRDVRLLKPMTYMNRSGQSVQSVASYLKLDAAEILVAHDELDLPPGTVRLKRGGGHGGHNGLRDLIAHIAKDFFRLRLGIGHPGHRDDVIGYVLQRASRADEDCIVDAIGEALDVLPILLGQGEQKAMHRLHSRAKPPADGADDEQGGKE